MPRKMLGRRGRFTVFAVLTAIWVSDGVDGCGAERPVGLAVSS